MTKSLQPKAIKWGPVDVISSVILAALEDHPSWPVSIKSINNKTTPIEKLHDVITEGLLV